MIDGRTRTNKEQTLPGKRSNIPIFQVIQCRRIGARYVPMADKARQSSLFFVLHLNQQIIVPEIPAPSPQGRTSKHFLPLPPPFD